MDLPLPGKIAMENIGHMLKKAQMKKQPTAKAPNSHYQ